MSCISAPCECMGNNKFLNAANTWTAGGRLTRVAEVVIPDGQTTHTTRSKPRQKRIQSSPKSNAVAENNTTGRADVTTTKENMAPPEECMPLHTQTTRVSSSRRKCNNYLTLPNKPTHLCRAGQTQILETRSWETEDMDANSLVT